MVGFVCRIGMASTDTAFVGHLTNATTGVFFDRPYSGEEYLAAASLSDMVVNILIVPPLAFNQVLNALVGQALGSDNKKMAGTWLQLSVFFLTTSYLPFMLIQYLFTADVLKLLGFNHDICELAFRAAGRGPGAALCGMPGSRGRRTEMVHTARSKAGGGGRRRPTIDRSYVRTYVSE
ncbi:hypothetical protein EMIHUDRAFT_223905 [Emiliania huxleyi CCMP1516]|uniref:Uncharacterized protein n=2 Tax=Emiliania huxleyi TaxID=2903 RepID=A0A0D3HZ84_EMIH1|nr:hypothetical protein EMIHUDRAFT_250590 [Emiliania huxleyi CCMP1516]XP_005791472.1 hypothetical protein EMIHUDRAFT_223905 [Emiliania huxleyi CCMP1516]EOD04319.1 hypothetical protein EMIHUDRAFT_250590 [Emiliania huxleyi CCMP1516]EOD39043.1 hypothetical protein EMIHUDRAFT_223905 [Emiliania huxleyi CCMP1516]|eukprot:XP_005756748.1 hypothetical protein EMIHUDRAFT_250590 [Emiliania huxleyi CCMP1516]